MSDIIQYQGGNVPSDPAQLDDYYAQYAEAYASTERRAGSSISVRNGVMSVGDQAIPGNQFAAIVLDAARLNTFYPTAFNPSVIEPPRCYAIGRTEADLAPHPDMQKDLNFFQAQAERCSACPHNQFGSGRDGKGKACSNRRRLLLLVAGVYVHGQLQAYTDLKHYEESPFLTMTLPPTSLKPWGEYVRNVAAQYTRPPFGVVTRVYLYAHPQHGKEAIGFEPLGPVPNDWAPVIGRRHAEAAQEIMEGYEAPMAQQHPQTHRGGGFHQQQAQAVQYAQGWEPQGSMG